MRVVQHQSLNSRRTPMKFRMMALSALVVMSVATPSLSQAQQGSSLAFNAALSSDYRYRGISQSRLKPALSAGLDYTLPEGFYIGAWASTIKWVKDAGGDAQLELDLYGGYKTELSKGMTLDVGLLQYVYPSARTPTFDALYKNPDTTEIYGALTVGPVTGKLSYALSNLFGNYDFARQKNSKGSMYFDLSANFEVGAGVVIIPHIGHQKVENISNASYTDYAITVSKDFSGFVLSAGLVGTDANKNFYIPGSAANSSKFLGKTAALLSLKYNF
jgi:uncharacterized protein (TIGR02001 family)